MKKSRSDRRNLRPNPPGQKPAGAAGSVRWRKVWILGTLALATIVGALVFRTPKTPPGNRPDRGASLPARSSVPQASSTPGLAVASPGDDASDLVDVAALLTGPRDDLGSASTKVLPGAGSQAQLIWDGLTDQQRERGALAAIHSNIQKEDYAGADSCKECHEKNYEGWSRHPHRWMNALAKDETVKGDFSSGRVMSYLGGKVQFSRDGTNRYMSFARGQTSRTYRITRTIGSRFTQYYAGRLTEGPEPATYAARTTDHVLAVGWWIDRQEWIPAVHIDSEGPDGARADPFATASDVSYDTSCAVCHTTPTMGDWMINPNGILRMGYYAPVPVEFDVKGYTAGERPDLHARYFADPAVSEQEKLGLIRTVRDQDVVQHAVNLGISCENCHHGSREHVLASDQHKSALLPAFFPVSSNVVAQTGNAARVYGRNPESVNFICARCHTGRRPYFASGMATWNSVEFSDAEIGFCYVRKSNTHPEIETLACTACHDPHQPIGPVWSKTPDEDDATCLKCHTQYEPEPARTRHTHHKSGTEGARCLNCHMPRLNEGLQDVVRTHAISNPTWPTMIEANQPNACNLCHLDQPIDWTITWLSRWYRIDRFRSYNAEKLAANYPDRTGPVGLNWLKSPHESTRLVAVDALSRANAKWALPAVVEALDDPYLLNRQFARIALERWLNLRLEDHGYRFYMTPEERREPVERVRAAVTGLIKR